ncbi:MAG: hypothetical protein ACE5JN_07335 [Candidatus Methylomirabilia bacterium]
MPITSNTSPLIGVAKIGRLKLLERLYGTVIISPKVKEECIDKGKEKGAPDAYEIEKTVQDGWIKEATLERKLQRRAEKLMQEARIGQGEAEAIVIAQEKKIPVILDEADARAAARAIKVDRFGTVMVPYEAFVKRLIPYKELITILTDLSKVLWVSPAVIAEIIRRAQEVRK